MPIKIPGTQKCDLLRVRIGYGQHRTRDLDLVNRRTCRAVVYRDLACLPSEAREEYALRLAYYCFQFHWRIKLLLYTSINSVLCFISLLFEDKILVGPAYYGCSVFGDILNRCCDMLLSYH